MKKALIILIISLLFSKVNAQSWSPEALAVANTAAKADYLSQEEKNVIFYLNLARADGALFFKTYFKNYVERNNIDMRKYSNYDELKIDKRDKYYRSLEDDLRKIKGLPILYPDEKLSKVSAAHAKDLDKNDLVSHNSGNGQTFVQRVSKVYPNKAIAENLAFGSATGLEIVCALLLDKGVPDLGHRLNILNSTYKLSHVGIAIGPHPRYKVCAVMDFAALNKVPNL